MPEWINTDVLIIGGGGAGLRAAIEAAEHGVDVLMISHSRLGYGSNTTISGGGFAAVTTGHDGLNDPHDSPEQHLEDTIVEGCFLCNQEMVSQVVHGAEDQAHALTRFGVKLADSKTSSWIDLSVDPGHTYRRTIYGQNAFGTDFTFPLKDYAQQKGIRTLEGVLVFKLLLDEGRVVGVLGIDSQGRILAISAASTVLATGGLGQLYRRTDNTAGTTGDGYALAYEAGAVLADMEFVQFYPTGLGSGSTTAYYENVVKAGGRLLNRLGEDIASKHGLSGSTAMTRDRLSYALAEELAQGLGVDDTVTLDLSGIQSELLQKLKPVLPKAAIRGQLQYQVAPTVHFHMGGVTVNGKAETSVPGLYAAGEICAGVHGANRLGSNSLTELWVFGTIAGREAALTSKQASPQRPSDSTLSSRIEEALAIPALSPDGDDPRSLHQSLKDTMWHNAGIIRHGDGLAAALEQLQRMRGTSLAVNGEGRRGMIGVLKLRNMLTVAEMVCRAALCRTESRGAHRRREYPATDNANWLQNILVRKQDSSMSLTTKPVKLTYLAPQ
jgi:succinate dehydrogenase/fumarate reductase flavoprotein subunit